MIIYSQHHSWTAPSSRLVVDDGDFARKRMAVNVMKSGWPLFHIVSRDLLGFIASTTGGFCVSLSVNIN